MINFSNKVTILTGNFNAIILIFETFVADKKTYVRILGASSGIGRATAILFSKLGSRLGLVGRNDKELDATINMCKAESNQSKTSNVTCLFQLLISKRIIRFIILKNNYKG